MAKKKNRKKRHNTALKHHKRQGKKLSPPMMTLPNLKLTYWLKDDLPDMLWLCMLCSKYGYRGMVIARKVFDTVEQVLKEEFGDLETVPKEVWVLGSLTSFDSLPEQLRPKIIQRLKLLGAYETAFPREFGIALSRYDNPPSKWLWEYPKPAKGFSKEEFNQAEALLRKTIEEAWSGRNQVATWAKMAVTSAMFSSGRVRLTRKIAEDWADLLPKYPNGLSEDDRKRAESSMRAFYQSMTLPMDGEANLPVEWAKDFWRTNWKLYECETVTETESMNKAEKEALDKFTKHLAKRLEILDKQFDEATKSDPDVYDPTRFEVLTGIVSRSRRAISLAVRTPSLWSTEHGSGLIRGLVESRIVLSWLIHKGDPELFEKFKNYGRGHLKLLKLHFEEYLDKQDKPNPELEAYVADLAKEVNQEISEEFQEIRVDTNFAGDTNIRKMAEEVGLNDDYRFIFAPASSASHGEWPIVDQFALDICRNPLHKGHRLAKKGEGITLGPSLIEFALDELEDLIQRYAIGVKEIV